MPRPLREVARLVESETGSTVRLVSAIPPDAGARTYYRVATRRGSLICCLTGRDNGSRAATERFLAVRDILEASGVRVPKVLGVNHAAGVMLLSDLGRQRLLDVLERGPSLRPAADACGIVAKLWRIPEAAFAGELPATAADYLAELEPVTSWYLRQAAAGRPPPERQEQVRSGLACVAEGMARQPTSFAHTDFHCRNVVWDKRGGLGVVDFQDARRASRYLDLAAMVYDQNFQRGPDRIRELVRTIYRRFFRHAPDGAGSMSEFAEGVTLAGAYWCLRIVGVCSRLGLALGRRRYLHEVGNALAYLGALAGQLPELRPAITAIRAAAGTAGTRTGDAAGAGWR